MEKAAAPKDKDTWNQRYQRKPWQWRNQNQGRFETTKKDPEEIPVLTYGLSNNFSKFKEAISKTALKNYGQIGKLIKLGK